MIETHTSSASCFDQINSKPIVILETSFLTEPEDFEKTTLVNTMRHFQTELKNSMQNDKKPLPVVLSIWALHVL